MGALTHNGEVLQRLPANASQINFDKTGTNLSATQTENAIKEVNGKVNDNADEIDELKSGLTDVNSKLTYMIINQITEVTFDENGRGTFTIPEGYHPLIASLDEAWFTAMHYNNGNFYVTAHSTVDPTVLIKSTTVTYYWFLYFG